jgi:hypothetical protein
MPSSKYKIPKDLKLSILKKIGYHWSDGKIVDWLKTKGVEVSKTNIRQNYRHNPAYQERIKHFSLHFEGGINEEPLQSKRHVLNKLNDAIESATNSGDFRQASALFKQALNLVYF